MRSPGNTGGAGRRGAVRGGKGRQGKARGGMLLLRPYRLPFPPISSDLAGLLHSRAAQYRVGNGETMHLETCRGAGEGRGGAGLEGGWGGSLN